jgi:hypothetical protein
MPSISMFYGIIIRMFFAPDEHNPPHFHATFQGLDATVNINTCEIIKSNFPRKQTKLILAWAELHQDELLANWELVMNGESPHNIDALK